VTAPHDFGSGAAAASKSRPSTASPRRDLRGSARTAAWPTRAVLINGLTMLGAPGQPLRPRSCLYSRIQRRRPRVEGCSLARRGTTHSPTSTPSGFSSADNDGRSRTARRAARARLARCREPSIGSGLSRVCRKRLGAYAMPLSPGAPGGPPGGDASRRRRSHGERRGSGVNSHFFPLCRAALPVPRRGPEGGPTGLSDENGLNGLSFEPPLWRGAQMAVYSRPTCSRACPSDSREPQSGAVASHGGKLVGKGIAPRASSEGFEAQYRCQGSREHQTLRR
jgi:hypothetical protein